MNLPLLGQNLDELTAWVESQQQPKYRGKQLYDWIYQRGVTSFNDITVFPKQWREQAQDVIIGRSIITHRSTAIDGTTKYLLQLADRQIIEAVGIPSDNRLTVCVSSQIGCAMACNFCATGKGGFIRHLSAAEIVDQVLTVQTDFHQRVSNIVFMGMGEPLANLPEVIKAIKCLNQDVGISQRTMTISSVGIPGKIHELATYNLQVTLAVSLHAPNQDLRVELIPTARNYHINDLMKECRDYVKITKRRISFEYILLADINDRPEQAMELADRLRGFQSHVNLIPYNPISEVDYQRPKKQRIADFVNVLKQERIAVSVRYSKGLTADAACGQLRANHQG